MLRGIRRNLEPAAEPVSLVQRVAAVRRQPPAATASVDTDEPEVDNDAEVEPVDAEMEAAPVDAEAEAEPVDAEAEAEPVDAEVEAAPVDAELEAEPVDAEVEAAPVDAEVEAQPVDAEAEAEPVDAEAEAAPVDAEVEAQPVDAEVEAAPENAEVEAAPENAEMEVVPLDAVVEVEPVNAEVDAEVAPANASSDDASLLGNSEPYTAPAENYEDLGPPWFLIISSPAERKVGFVGMEGLRPVSSLGSNETVFPLIDAGLQAPSGLAYDEATRSLYVADPGLRQILHFRIRVTQCAGEGCAPVTGDGSAFRLEVEGSRHVVVDDVDATWLAVDSEGNVYFSDQEEDTINRVDSQVLAQETESGVIQDTLVHASTADIEALTHSSEESFTDESGVTILYHTRVKASDGKPAGISIVGDRLIWANEGGDGMGSIEEGSIDGWDPVPGSEDGETAVLVSGTAALAGVTATEQFVLFAGSGNHTSGVPRGGGNATTITESIRSPRALVWDGDNTIFVADSVGNAILSVPCGTLPSRAVPAEVIAVVHQPFGLAIVRDQALASAASVATPAHPPSDPSWGPVVTETWESAVSFVQSIFYALR